MVEQAICRILEGNSRRVIVPGWGAFIKRESGEIVFTDILKTDDGVLTGHIAGNDRTAWPAAQAEVTRFAEKARKDIASQGYTEVDGLGTVLLTSAGKYKIILAPIPANAAPPHQVEAENTVPATGNTERHETVTATPVTEVKPATTPAAANSIAEAPDTTAAPYAAAQPDSIAQPINTEGQQEHTAADTPSIQGTQTAPAGKSRLRSALYGEERDEEDTLYAAPSRSNAGATPATRTTPATENAATQERTPSQRPEIHIRRPAKPRKRADIVMIIAVIALIITLAVTIYGVLTERSINSMRGEEMLIELNGAETVTDTAGDAEE